VHLRHRVVTLEEELQTRANVIQKEIQETGDKQRLMQIVLEQHEKLKLEADQLRSNHSAGVSSHPRDLHTDTYVLKLYVLTLTD